MSAFCLCFETLARQAKSQLSGGPALFCGSIWRKRRELEIPHTYCTYVSSWPARKQQQAGQDIHLIVLVDVREVIDRAANYSKVSSRRPVRSDVGEKCAKSQFMPKFHALNSAGLVDRIRHLLLNGCGFAAFLRCLRHVGNAPSKSKPVTLQTFYTHQYMHINILYVLSNVGKVYFHANKINVIQTWF